MTRIATLLLLLTGLGLSQTAPAHEVLDLLWSPDGSRVAIVLSGSGPATEIRVLHPGGGEWSYLVDSPTLRLVGWTPDGEALALDRGEGELELLRPRLGPIRRFAIPWGAIPIATDGTVAYYFSQDGSHLLADDGLGRAETVAYLAEGTRPSGTLSADGKHLALRRAVKSGDGWSTEIWVLSQGAYARAAVVRGSFVKISWHPDRPALVANVTDASKRWSAYLVDLTKGQVRLGSSLPSPVQWDRQGRLYVADGSGLWDLSNGRHPLHVWRRLPDLWAVSPAGDLVVAAPGGNSPVAFFSLR